MHRSHAGSIAAYSTVAHPPTQIGTHPAQPIESSQYWSPRAQAHLARLPLGSRTGGGHSTPRAAADGLGDERADAGAGAEEGGGELDAELVRADEGHGGRGRRHRTVSRRRRPEAEPRPRAEQSKADRVSKRSWPARGLPLLETFSRVIRATGRWDLSRGPVCQTMTTSSLDSGADHARKPFSILQRGGRQGVEISRGVHCDGVC